MEKENMLIDSFHSLNSLPKSLSIRGNLAENIRKCVFVRNFMKKEDIQINQLIIMGYNELIVNRLYNIYLPDKVEEAIEFLTPINRIYQHPFYHSNISSTKCFICNQEKSIHINTFPKLTIDERIEIRNNDAVAINIENKQKCEMCFNIMSNQAKTKLSLICGHSCCFDCWKKYFKEELNKSMITPLHCFSLKCHELLTDDFILSIIKDENQLIVKYEQLKIRIDIYTSQNKKFCPTPDCISYLETKEEDNKYSKCENDHEYCYICLNPWHGKHNCDEEVDKEFQLWKKGKTIKQYPNCQLWTEKHPEHNNMKCPICEYQWCWLCNEQYNGGHYSRAGCRMLRINQINDDDPTKEILKIKVLLESV